MFIMETTFAYVGTAASIVGLVVAAIQTVRARQLRRYADHLERIRRVNVWAFIGMTLEAFDTLDELREIEIAECNEAQIAAKIASARRPGRRIRTSAMSASSRHSVSQRSN